MRTLSGLLAAVARAVPGPAGPAQWGAPAVVGGTGVGSGEGGAASRPRIGARGAVALEWPLSGRCTGSLRATGVLSGSVMNRDETPAGVERRKTRRRGVSIGLRYRL